MSATDTVRLVRYQGARLADAGQVAGVKECGFDGLITTGKFCCTRWGRLRLDWSRRPVWVRPSAGQAVVVAGAQDGADLDCPPPDQPPPRRRPPLGPGLPAAGALGDGAARRRPGGGADATGGA